MKQYTSKDEIYQDYQIAIRLILQGGIYPGDYNKLPLLATKERLKVQQYTEYVKNFRGAYPLSVGFCFEVPMKGDTGEVYATKLVVLGHETGAEIFLPLAITAATWVGVKVGEKVFDKSLDTAFKEVLDFLKRELYGGVRIDRIEIRSADKGVLIMPFSAFNMNQIRCLAERFEQIQTLKEAVDECFSDAAHTISFKGTLSSYE